MEEKTVQKVIDIPEGYEIIEVTDNKILLTKEKPKHPNAYKYPSTYEECCKVLGRKHYDQIVTQCDTEAKKNFQKLKLCRDAYWRIAGEQFGWGKPWRPNWCDETILKFVIIYTDDHNIIPSSFYKISNFYEMHFTFPTKEMRDSFLENFRDLIEAYYYNKMTDFEKYLKKRNIPLNSLEANSIREGIEWTINKADDYFNKNLTEYILCNCDEGIKKVNINEFIKDFKQFIKNSVMEYKL
jgi:hypothetical protein